MSGSRRRLVRLHVVERRPDGTVVLDVRADGAGRFVLPAGTPRVPQPRRRALGAGTSRSNGTPAQVTVAEIQARLRAGASPKEVATGTGAELDRVLRWAGPVEAEKTDVLRQTLSTEVVQDHLVSDGPLRTLLEAWLGRKLDEDGSEWLVARRADGRWRVTGSFTVDDGLQTATWVWDPSAREVTTASARARAISFPRDPHDG